ncbi:MAG: hypothetical protein CVU44_00830 [Chloroflexi bacterium HGW-Chloroflexi-6]|nr:MAG: hypothetical protein CVU44_00830 [Chloroflexi bacterium HGW-Chloroflexi-6]
MKVLVGKAESECNSSESHRAQNCTEYLGTNLITAEEWESLFPEAQFYLIEEKQIVNPETNMNGFVQRNFIIVKQRQSEYRDEDFDKLLADNQIAITEDNIEIILRAFAKITAANHHYQGIIFSPLEKVNYAKGEARHPYNYHLIALAGENKTELNWYFVVKKDQLRIATFTTYTLKDYYFSP